MADAYSFQTLDTFAPGGRWFVHFARGVLGSPYDNNVACFQVRLDIDRPPVVSMQDRPLQPTFPELQPVLEPVMKALVAHAESVAVQSLYDDLATLLGIISRLRDNEGIWCDQEDKEDYERVVGLVTEWEAFRA